MPAKDIKSSMLSRAGAMERINFFCGIILSTCLLFILSGNGWAFDSKPIDNSPVEIEYGYPSQSIFVAKTNYKERPDTPMLFLAEALMTRAGLSWHAKAYPAKRLFRNLKRGRTDFSILVRAPSLLESCIFSQKPVYSTHLNIYYIGDKPPVSSKEDLIGTRVLTIRGYSYGNLIQFISDPTNKIVNVVTNAHGSAFAMLKLDRADYLLDYASAAGDILSESPIAELKSTAIDQLDIFLVLSRSYPNAEKLMVKLEKIVETLDVNEILKFGGHDT